jgi:hypothetical protein
MQIKRRLPLIAPEIIQFGRLNTVGDALEGAVVEIVSVTLGDVPPVALIVMEEALKLQLLSYGKPEQSAEERGIVPL